MQNEIKNLAISLGADTVGFCKLSDENVFTQNLQLSGLSYGVSIGVKLSDAILKTIEKAPSFAYFQHYRTANTLLDTVAFRVASFIEKQGYLALPVAASQSQGKQNPYEGLIPHKTIAVLSGLGFVGKSGLFISPTYGSKLRLATVLTNMPLTEFNNVIQNACGTCTACRDACPAGAIFGELPKTDGQRNFDEQKCSHYMKEHFQDIGRGSVCGVCIKVCPYNKL